MIKTIKILTLAVIVSAIGFSSCSKEKTYSSADEMINAMKAKVESLNVEELNTKLENMETYFLLIDVREPSEHNFGYIPGSINIPAGTIIFKMGNEDFWESEMMYLPEKADEIILYCKKGSRWFCS